MSEDGTAGEVPEFPTLKPTVADLGESVATITDPPGAGELDHWASFWEGREFGAGVSVIRLNTSRVDVGPPLHQHPYPEIVEMRQGRAVFIVGGRRLTVSAGQTLIIPAQTPHSFRTLGPDRCETVAHHLSSEFINELLEEDNGFGGSDRLSQTASDK